MSIGGDRTWQGVVFLAVATVLCVSVLLDQIPYVRYLYRSTDTCCCTYILAIKIQYFKEAWILMHSEREYRNFFL